MRSIQSAVAVLALGSLLGCGGSQPSVYFVAVEPLHTQKLVEGNCYSQAPTNPNTTSNVVDQEQWVIWEGIEDKEYLDPGSINYGMGDAENVSIGVDAIEGGERDGKRVFTTEQVETESANEKYTTAATYTFDELGDTLKGTLELRSSCAGAECGNAKSCTVTLGFSGRKIDAEQNLFYLTGSGD